MNVVISDPASGKAYPKKVDNPAVFMNKKTGDEVDLGFLGLEGYRAKITGGSDKQGFAMRADLPGTARKKIFVMENRKKGLRRRISVRGNTVSAETQQLNLAITKAGAKKIDEIIVVDKKETKLSVKEEEVLRAHGKLKEEAGEEAKEKKAGQQGKKQEEKKEGQ